MRKKERKNNWCCLPFPALRQTFPSAQRRRERRVQLSGRRFLPRSLEESDGRRDARRKREGVASLSLVFNARRAKREILNVPFFFSILSFLSLSHSRFANERAAADSASLLLSSSCRRTARQKRQDEWQLKAAARKKEET